ncbi:hypothetical protein OIO03_23640, partial [Acinetobacter baumannii]|nr:hypothetical protein [Acinetobacter baumannii]MCW1766595.1 hypothetical protein [Acinetobacter baumannii]
MSEQNSNPLQDAAPEEIEAAMAANAADELQRLQAELAELKANGKLSDKLRFALSVAAFHRIAQYDGAISDYLSSVKFEDDQLSEAYVPERSAFPGQSNGHFTTVQDLRYGDNSP